MSGRKVLLVTPYFAPQSHAAVFRVHKLAKYLPQFGWKPYVLTTDTNYLYNEDPDLEAELSGEVEIHRVRYVEPTLRGLRMASGGRDRTFNAYKNASLSNGVNAFVETTRGPGLLQRLYSWILDSWLQVPDPYWTWRGPAIRKGLELIHQEQIPVVYTTFLPYTCNVIGFRLQRSGCRWVADFRDPGTHSHRMSSKVPRVLEKQRRIERETIAKADQVTALSSAYSTILGETHGPFRDESIRFIPTGADQQLFPAQGSAPIVDYPYLLFAGEFLPEYGTEFFEVFAGAIKNPVVRDLGVKLLFVGHVILNRGRVEPLLRPIGLEGHVEFVDHVPQKTLYRFVAHARACLLIPGRDTHWWASFAKMADFIALRRPTIAIVPDPSEVRSELSKAGLGVFLDGDPESSIGLLADFLLGRLPELHAREAICELYTAHRQVGAFANVLEGLRAGPQGN